MSDPRPLEQAPVEQLARELLVSVREHYLRRPTSRATAQEALNALAVATAVVFAAARECGDEEGAREFFNLAVDNQLGLEDGLPTNLGELIGWTR
jgi:hypothetical protein